MDAWLKARGAPVISLGLRWERLLAWAQAQKGGPMAHICPANVAWSVDVPVIASALFSTWSAPEDVAQEAIVSRPGFEPVRARTIPAALMAMVARQGRFERVFHKALDEVCERMAKSKEECTDERALERWNGTMDALGMVQASVWIGDPLEQAAGIWRAALDEWTFGSSTWPV